MEHHSCQDASTEELLAEYARTRDPELRTAVIERHAGLVRAIASKFARIGVDTEDLVQAGCLALVKAVDRFEPDRGVKFITYATHCVAGEIKRYFRDHTWGMRVSRRLQEISTALPRMQDQLYQKLQREPTVQEMAEAFNVPEEELLHAIELGQVYTPRSLDETLSVDEGTDTTTLADRVGEADLDLEAVVEHSSLREALDQLDPRERTIVQLRFFRGCSQQEVARELHVSQMHVSRLERRMLSRLRGLLGVEEAPPRRTRRRAVAA